MADLFRIIPYQVRSAGTDVPPEEVQAGINSLANQTTIALNSVAADPTGPAGGDLGGTYPNPTVVALHVTSGTESGVTVTGNTINSSPIGQSVPAAGAFTTLTATTPVAATSGGTGRNALTANAVLIGEGSSQVNFAAPGAAGGMLISQGAAADPAFANNPTITGGSVNNAPVGATTPSTGAFTTLSSTGNFTPSQTNGIVGTTTNNNANAGSVGEYLTNTTNATSLTTSVTANATSVSLTAGDWDVTGMIQFVPGAGVTTTVILSGLNTTSATLGAFPMNSVLPGISAPAANGSLAWPAPLSRFSLSATTTIFLVANAAFSGGTMTCNGFIRARRVR